MLTFSKVSRGILFQWGMTAWEPERAKMAAKSAIFASVLKNLNVKSLIFALSFNFWGQEMGP